MIEVVCQLLHEKPLDVFDKRLVDYIMIRWESRDRDWAKDFKRRHQCCVAIGWIEPVNFTGKAAWEIVERIYECWDIEGILICGDVFQTMPTQVAINKWINGVANDSGINNENIIYRYLDRAFAAWKRGLVV